MKKMDLDEFHKHGFLQEVNRQFFHPLGLAMFYDPDPEVKCPLGIYDARDDPEGFIFFDLSDRISYQNAENVSNEAKKHRAARIEMFDYWSTVQPLGDRREE